jgi:hypothetical protein
MNEQKEFLHPSLTSRKIKFRIPAKLSHRLSYNPACTETVNQRALRPEGAINDRRMITRSGVNGMGVDLLSF